MEPNDKVNSCLKIDEMVVRPQIKSIDDSARALKELDNVTAMSAYSIRQLCLCNQVQNLYFKIGTKVMVRFHVLLRFLSGEDKGELQSA